MVQLSSRYLGTLHGSSATLCKPMAMAHSPAHSDEGSIHELHCNSSLPLALPAGFHPPVETRIARWDASFTPYTHAEFCAYYTEGPGTTLWHEAVPYRDAAGHSRQVLVMLGTNRRWGLIDRVSQESDVLAIMLECEDETLVLNLNLILGSDVSDTITYHLLEYLCGYDSTWWQQEPSFGALDAADRLGMTRLLSHIVRKRVMDAWTQSRQTLM